MQEFLIRFICGSSLVPFGYILLVCILAEMSLGRPKIKDGILQVRKNSFVLKYIYKNNIGKDPEKMKYPKDICQLFWGIYWGIFHSIFFLIIGVVIILIALFFGFAPRCGEGAPFEPYQTYKKTNKKTGEVSETKKFIAPWKIILGFIVWYQFAIQPDRTFGVIAKTPGVIAELFSMAITGLFIPVLYVGAICFVIYLIYFIIKKTFTATREFLEARNKKICINVELV